MKMTPRICAVMCAGLLGLVVAPAWSQDRADIDRTQIIGNRELPKVLYIVPWKKPIPGELSGRPVVSVLDEALAPVDRDVFRRQLQYDGQLRARNNPAPADTTANASAPTNAITTATATAPRTEKTK